ncbi:MAG: type II secretion system protein [Candidatus Moraniibacteriota bacterium]
MVKKKKGFTLVELMVVMAMTAIMLAVTLTSLSGVKDRKAVEGEARKMAATIREMQNYALTGRQMGVGQVTCGVGIDSISDTDTSYRVSYAYRSGATCANSPTFVSLSTNSLSNGVKFFVGSSNTTDAFYFKVPRGNLMDRSSVAVTTAQLIVLQKNTASYSVCIYPVGIVTETEGVLPSCPSI